MSKYIFADLLLSMLLLSSCGLSNNDIENYHWKFSDIRRGDISKPLLHQVDHISFGESRYYFLVKDTLYREDQPYAVIIDRAKRPSVSIEIVLIGTQDTLRYVGK